MEALKRIKTEFSEFFWLVFFAFKWLFNYKELGIASLHGEVLSVKPTMLFGKVETDYKTLVVLPSPFMSNILWYKGEFLATDGGMLVFVKEVDAPSVQVGDYVQLEGVLVYNKAFKRKARLQLNAQVLDKLGNKYDGK